MNYKKKIIIVLLLLLHQSFLFTLIFLFEFKLRNEEERLVRQ